MVLIYQSYRTENVPPWVARCMESVRDWARKCAYDYRFIDDSLFTYAPEWYREKTGHNIQLVSDLARLVLARKFLKEGYKRVVWIDADLLIFDQDMFSIDTHSSFSFCRETWLDEDLDKCIIHQEKVNNSVSVFAENNSFLDFYIESCLRIAKSRNDFEPVTVGTTYLTALREIMPFPVVRNVGIISPAIVYGIVRSKEVYLNEYLKRHGSAVYAANLCGSKNNEAFRDLKVTDALMEEVASFLIRHKSLLSSIAVID